MVQIPEWIPDTQRTPDGRLTDHTKQRLRQTEDVDKQFEFARLTSWDLGTPSGLEPTWAPTALSWIVRDGRYERLGGMRVRTLEPFIECNVRFCNDAGGTDLFLYEAGLAGRLLTNPPPERAGGLRGRLPKTLDGLTWHGPDQWWVLTLWHLAWARPTGTPLAATRYHHVRGPAEMFYSPLAGNPFHASAYALEYLTRITDRELPSLTPKEQAVFDIIREQPIGRGIIGKDIIKMAKKRGVTISSENVLTRHIIPKLRPYGVVNAGGGRGYVVRPM
jgi:hypothetical protein